MDESEGTAAAPDGGAAPPLTRFERLLVRMTLWQTVLSLAGIVVAIAALHAALTESSEVRRQTAASVWPFVQLQVEDHLGGDGAHFVVAFRNVGVGPALLRRVRLDIAGQPAADWAAAVAAVGGDPAAPVGRNFVNGRVLAPGERVVMLQTADPDLVGRFQAALADPATVIDWCWCSIFEDCWRKDSRGDTRHPTAVAACPEPAAGGFGG